MRRDPDQCREFLLEAERRAGWRSEFLEGFCAGRLESKGGGEYEEEQFLTADCLAEAQEEAADGAGGWLALDHQKMCINDELDPTELELILDAAAHFIHAYRILESVQKRRRERAIE